MDGIDWNLLAEYFPPDDLDGFYGELYGSNYRRDITKTSRSVHDSLDECLRILDGCDEVSENGRSAGMEGEILSSVPSTTTNSNEKIETKSSISSCVSSSSMRGMQIRQRDRRCDGREDCVSCVWPDPATGCVLGGHCALLVRSNNELGPCMHPPVQTSNSFLNRNSFVGGQFPSYCGQRDSVPYASRSRWRRDNRRQREKNVKTYWP